MKKVILVALFIPVIVSAQLSDNFESGSLSGWVESVSGRWCADSDQALNGIFSLRHCFDNQSAGLDCTGLPVHEFHPSEGTLRWSFLVRHGGDPSSLNNWAIFLMSDMDPSSIAYGSMPEGYAVGVNLTGYDDTLRMWKIENGSPEIFLTTGLNWQSDIGSSGTLKIEIERSIDGDWKLLTIEKDNSVSCEVSGTENWLPEMNWFIVLYRYSSTRDMLLWIDDLRIEGVFYSDTTYPSVMSCTASSANSLKMIFSEKINYEVLKKSDFILNGGCEALVVNKLTDRSCEVFFKDSFNNKKKNLLQIKSLCDLSGNCQEGIITDFIPAWAETGDIVISEIMADPVPPVSLPACEYLELYNRSPFTFNLNGWVLSSGSEKITLPAYQIPPLGYLILCHVKDTSFFKAYGICLGLKSFPALTDSGKQLVLSDTSFSLIHGVYYNPDWYGSALKKNGGWSLELIDTDFPFFYEGNWEASSSREGGTPGRPNDVSRENPDELFRGLDNVFAVDSLSVRIKFSEPLIMTGKNAGKFFQIDGKPVSSFCPDDLLQMNFTVVPGETLVPDKIFCFSAGGLTDFAGNEPVRSIFEFGLARAPLAGDVRFNELMFDPLPGDPDFIEFYNYSGKIINAAALYLASVNSAGDSSELVQVSAHDRSMLPGSYYVITSDRDRLIAKFPFSDEANIFETSDLPSMPDAEGLLLLFDRSLRLIDRVYYSSSMHHPMISGSEGISLEKVRTGLDSCDPTAWHSASESSGWASPGKPNSVSVPDPQGSDRISFSSDRISPDNDGYEDVLVIDFRLEGRGSVITVSVFDEWGRLINRLCENFLAGMEASVVWDGKTGTGEVAVPGIYVIHILLFDEKGKTSISKKAFAVISGRR
jgi:hypothetical protein